MNLSCERTATRLELRTKGTWTISELAVLPHEKKNVSLKVDIPLKVNKGTYRFTVVAEGLGELPIAITVSKQGTYQTDFTTNQPNMQGNSKTLVYLQCHAEKPNSRTTALCADGTSSQRLERGLQGKLQASHIGPVEPNATQSITIDINPPANVEAGSYKIPVRATTSTTSAELELEVVITGTYQMELDNTPWPAQQRDHRGR